MRITDNMRLLSLIRDQSATSLRTTNASRRAASGQKVTKPSDDPVSYATAVRRDGAYASMASRTRTARDAADELTIAERALDSASSMVEQAQGLAVQGANETLSQADRDALALQVDGLREQVLQIANTRGSNGYVFAGTRTNVAPFDAAGNFVGNDGVTVVPVTDGIAPRGNASGARAFTAAGGRDVLSDLASLAAALRSGNIGQIRQAIDDLRGGHDQVVHVQVEAGLSIEQLQATADVLEAASVAVQSSKARATGADDPSSLYAELSAATAAFDRSLQVTKQILNLPSLAGN